MSLPKRTVPSERLPREVPSLKDGISAQHMSFKRGRLFDDIWKQQKVYPNLQEAIRSHPLGTPFLTAMASEAIIGLKLPVYPDNELRGLIAALDQKAVDLEIGAVFTPTYPILRLILPIYDSPPEALICEACFNVTLGDVQDFIETVSDTCYYQLNVYLEENLTHLKGVKLRIPTAYAAWLKRLWSEITRQYYLIAPAQRDYNAACQQVHKEFPLGSWEQTGLRKLPIFTFAQKSQ